MSRSYSMYARYYDALNTDYDLWHSVIRKSLEGEHETGKMIDQAAAKIPNGHFYRDDMVTFSSSETFDDNFMIMDLLQSSETNFVFNVRIFSSVRRDRPT